MAASSDSDLYNSEQWSSTRGLSPSWEDDETTMAYSSQHLQTLQRHGGSSPPPLAADAGSGEWDDASSGYDPAPIVLEIFDARASTTLPRPRAQPTSRKTQAGMPTAAAAHARQLRRSGPQPSAAATQPRLRARTRAAVQSAPPAARHHDPRRTGPQPPQRTAAAIERRPLATLANSTRVELEDEPFARPSAWRGPLARSVAGAIGLVGAVLSGMVLLDASAGEPATVSAEQLSVPAAAVALLPSTPTPAQPARDAPQETPSVPAATIAPIEARGHVAPSHAASHSHSFTRTATAAHPPRKPVAHEINEPTDTGARETPKPAREVAAVERGSAAPGTLRINSRPWSQVYVDGRLFGTTPQMGIEVQPGSHSVRLLNAEFSMSKTFQIAVASGKTVTRVEMLTE